MALRGWFLAALIGSHLPLPAQAGPRATADNTLESAIAAFEQRGFVIRRAHPRCQQASLFGLYVRGRREVVVCPRGNQRETLLHEGWHAVQSLCLRGPALLGTDALLRRLGRQDRRELELLYRPDQWPREAEARLMAQEPLEAYLQVMDQACDRSGSQRPGAEVRTLSPRPRFSFRPL